MDTMSRACWAVFTIGKMMPSGPTSSTGLMWAIWWSGTRTNAQQPLALVAMIAFLIIGWVMPACSLSIQM